jgi:2-oxoglutarate ferredoxin oxidoreductase subunit beta
MEGVGFALVEFLSSCPTNWRLNPAQALEWIKEDMEPYYPLGDYKVSDIAKQLQ